MAEPAAPDGRRHTHRVTAAASLVTPVAITRQNSRSISRRCDGAPGDFISERPVNSFIHPAGLPINTSIIKVLRRPVESTQYTSVRFGETLLLAGMIPSIGTVGDAYDNALCETIIGLYKTECTRTGSPFRTGDLDRLSDLEAATAAWVHWYNNHRLMHRLGRIPPAEYEANYYAKTRDGQPAAHT